MKDCPHKVDPSQQHSVACVANEEDNEEEEEVILLQTKDFKDKTLGTLVEETRGAGVVDSGCSRTVAGEEWLTYFEDSVNQKFEKRESQQKFKFGKGEAVQSVGKVKLPIQLGTKKVHLLVDIVKVNIPLLLSKESMKKANTVLNFEKDTAEMFGQVIPLISTTSGHYALPIIPSRREDTTASHVAFVNVYFSDQPKYNKIALKLHKHFCHCPADRLKKFIKKSRLWKGDKKLLQSIDDVSESCRLCITHKKNPPTSCFSSFSG